MPTSTVMPEPDETTTCQQLTSCLTGPYQPTHAEFIDSLAEHVLQYRIGPPLQRSLLMIFIQDQRERLRQHSSSCSGLVSVVMPSLHEGSGVDGAACCDNEDHRLRIKRWRTNRWQGILARRGRLRVRKRCRRSEMLMSNVFANMCVSTACSGSARPRFLIVLCAAGRVALQVLSTTDFGGSWLQVMVRFAHDLHDIARWCLGLSLALLSLLNIWTPEALVSWPIRCLLQCTFALEGVHRCRWMCCWPSSGGRLVIYCLGQSIVDCICWTNAIASALLLRSIRLIFFLLWPVNIFLHSWQSHSPCRFVLSPLVVARAGRIAIYWEVLIGHVGLVCRLCHSVRSLHLFRFVELYSCKHIYNVSSMRMMSSLLWLVILHSLGTWDQTLYRILLPENLRQQSIRASLTRLRICLARRRSRRTDVAVWPNLDRLKHLISLPAQGEQGGAWMGPADAFCVSLAWCTPTYGRDQGGRGYLPVVAQLGALIEVFRRSRCLCLLCDFCRRSWLPPLPWMRQVLTLQLTIVTALALRFARMTLSTLPLMVHHQQTLYIPMILRIFWARLPQTHDRPMVCVQYLDSQCQMVWWLRLRMWKIFCMPPYPLPWSAVSLACLFIFGTQVAMRLWRQGLILQYCTITVDNMMQARSEHWDKSAAYAFPLIIGYWTLCLCSRYAPASIFILYSFASALGFAKCLDVVGRCCGGIAYILVGELLPLFIVIAMSSRLLSIHQIPLLWPQSVIHSVIHREDFCSFAWYMLAVVLWRYVLAQLATAVGIQSPTSSFLYWSLPTACAIE